MGTRWTSENRAASALLLNSFAAVLGMIGVAICFARRGTGNLWYYTQDSNLLAALVSWAFVPIALRLGARSDTRRTLHDRRVRRIFHLLRYVSVVGLAVTFLVVVFVLAPNPLSGGFGAMMLEGTNLLLHTICPLLSIASFVLFERPRKEDWADPVREWEDQALVLPKAAPLMALVPTIVYAAFLYPANALGIVRGPYPFFLVNEMPLWQTFAWLVGLLAAVLVIAWCLKKANQR